MELALVLAVLVVLAMLGRSLVCALGLFGSLGREKSNFLNDDLAGGVGVSSDNGLGLPLATVEVPADAEAAGSSEAACSRSAACVLGAFGALDKWKSSFLKGDLGIGQVEVV